MLFSDNHCLERKSTPRYGSSSPNEEEGTGGKKVGNNISNIDDSYTLHGLRKETTRVLEQVTTSVDPLTLKQLVF